MNTIFRTTLIVAAMTVLGCGDSMPEVNNENCRNTELKNSLNPDTKKEFYDACVQFKLFGNVSRRKQSK
jgi:entry exclusion lipoprotein TrbK